MTQPAECLRAIVHGRVQGVNFRYFTQLQAQALGVTGWVMNRPDGTVEVMAHGPRPALDELLAFLQHGPRHAEVARVDAEWRQPAGRFNEFRIIH